MPNISMPLITTSWISIPVLR